jgi:uncharacterized protein (TIRG00374 family)
VWWSIKDLTTDDRSQIKNALRNARYWLIIPVFGMLFLSHFIRALRWRLLIEPLGFIPSKANTFFAVLIGYLANQAVPRLGEVLKCTVLARYEKIPADKLVGTIILERLVDALTLLTIFAITLAIQPSLYSQIMKTFFHPSASSAPSGKKTATWVILLIIVGVIVLLLLSWMLIKKKTISDLGGLVKKIWQSILQGVGAIRHLKKRKLFILLTISLWTLYLMGGYIGFMALQETSRYGIKESFTVLSAGSIGMIVTPGGIGAYAYMIQKTMQLYGLNEGIALAFGWILWLATTAVILIGGLISFVAIPYYNKKRTGETR